VKAIAGQLGEDRLILRAMPNTPARDRQGHHGGLCAARHRDDRQRSVCRASGDRRAVVFLDDESQNGCGDRDLGLGSAYLFHFVECLAAAGEAEGLRAALAMQFARATLSGAGALLEARDESAATLRAEVTKSWRDKPRRPCAFSWLSPASRRCSLRPSPLRRRADGCWAALMSEDRTPQDATLDLILDTARRLIARPVMPSSPWARCPRRPSALVDPLSLCARPAFAHGGVHGPDRSGRARCFARIGPTPIHRVSGSSIS